MPRRLGLAVFVLTVSGATLCGQEPAPPEIIEVLPAEVPSWPYPWYSSAELLIGSAHIQSGYGPQVRFGALVSPEFQVGYQFESGRSAHADFRFFGASDSPHRVYGSTLDLDFRFRESDWSDTLLLPFLRTRWEIGLRAANFYLETRQDRNDSQLWGAGAVRSDSFSGLGPHVDYRLSIPIPAWGLEVFTEVDLALLWGRRNQRVEPIGTFIPDTTMFGWSDRLPYDRTRSGAGAGNAQWRVGASWGGPLFGRQLRFTAGYVADYWSFHSVGGGGGGFMSWSSPPEIDESSLQLGGAFLQVQWSW